MFLLREPRANFIAENLSLARTQPAASPELMTLRGGLESDGLPFGFSYDVSRSVLGRGEVAFARARAAMQRWIEFDLGWVRVANPDARIAQGEAIAVVAQTAGLWSINISRITDVMDLPQRFGFLYTTTRMHVEEGQERFVVELDEASGEVRYLIEALSRPRHALARLGWPLARIMQHRFARQSHERMRRAVQQEPG